MTNEFGKQKKPPRICAKQPGANDNLCMFYALENALQETGCLTEYINEGSQNSYDRFRNLIHYFSELLVEKFKDLTYTVEDMEGTLLEGADPAFVLQILLNLGFTTENITLLEFLKSSIFGKVPFSAVLGLVGKAEPMEPGQSIPSKGSLAHFIAWISVETEKASTKGYVLDSLRADDPVPLVDLVSWIKGNAVPNGEIVLELSNIILIWK
jgi:hypothetical protein